MALKLKQYTPTYKGLDFAWYESRKAPFIVIITNRNTGKTTNTFGWLIENKKKFLILTRWKNEKEHAESKLLAAKEYYGGNIDYNKKEQAFVDSETQEVMGFIGSISGANAIKNASETYREVEYIIFDEFLPTDGRYIKESSQPGYELEQLKSIIASVRKGKDGEYTRQVKIILMANLVDALNPYLKGMYDSNGDSLLTIVARAQQNGQTNLTHDDPMIFLTVHIDDSFEHDDPLSRFLGGGGGVAKNFLQDFHYRVRPRTKYIQDQLKRPLIRTGKNALYKINLKTSLTITGQNIDFDRYVYYWAPNRGKPSTAEQIQRIDYAELQHWYSDIVVKAETQDFMHHYKLESAQRF